MSKQSASDISTNNLPDMVNIPKQLDLILLSGRIGIIANAIAKRLNTDGVRALELFYESSTCTRLHDKATGLYLYGDLYIADEFIREQESKQ